MDRWLNTSGPTRTGHFGLYLDISAGKVECSTRPLTKGLAAGRGIGFDAVKFVLNYLMSDFLNTALHVLVILDSIFIENGLMHRCMH